MKATKTIVYTLITFAGAAAVILIFMLKQPYGLIALPFVIAGALAYHYIKLEFLKWTFTFLTIGASLFCTISGILFIQHNNKQRKLFNSETAVYFEKTNFEGALSKAKKEKKAVFVDFYTAWCGPCLLFNRTVLMNKQVAYGMNRAFVNIKFDAEVGEGIELAKRYSVKAYPTLLVLDSNGKIIEHVNEHFLPDEKFMETLANKYLNQENRK